MDECTIERQINAIPTVMSDAEIPFRSVPVFENLTEEEIMNEMKHRKPILIRNYNIGPCLEIWSPEYLSRKIADTPVKIHVSAHPKLDFINKNFLYKTLPFNELMSRITRSENENFFLHPQEFYYLRWLGPDPRGKEVANFLKDHPELAEDFKVPKVFNEEDFFSAVLRISSSGVQLWTHYDIMDNILIQVRGKKKVILWPPSEVDKLYLIGDKSKILDVERPHPEKYPKFTETVRYQCILEEGDAIFIPALWFHNVTAIETSIGVNIFWKNLPHEFYDNKDTYGNKDLIVANKAFSALEKSLKSLDELPFEFKQFYLKRMANQIEDKLQRIGVEVHYSGNTSK